jgi:hypothetical protein
VKREATADAISDRDRASATPALRRHEARAPVVSKPLGAERERTLSAQQDCFFRAVTTPESEPALLDDAAAARLVTASARLSALDRLEIYRQAYHARLIECLADDYSVLQVMLGDQAFEALARAYIHHHPSRGPSLNRFGAALPEFCRRQPLPEPVFAANLASLEWAIVDAIHAPTVSGITAQAVAEVSPERWPTARLRPNPSLRILVHDYPANQYFQAVRGGGSAPVPSRAPSTVAVYRTGMSVWRMELAPGFVALVECLASGVALGDALSRVEPLLGGETEAEQAQTLGNWFRHTVSSGLFCALEFGSTEK